MDFNKYFDNQELQAVMESWVKEYPALLNLEVIGYSYENKPIWLITITNKETGAPEFKPAVWIDANIHATELTGTTVALHLAHTLLHGFQKDERISRLIDYCTFYIVPRVNPDGAELAMAPNPRFIRSGVRPYPWEQKDSGLHQCDIDEDGKILQMRIPDPNGDWKISTLDPRLMEKRAPLDLTGNFYRLLPEGLIENYDGFTIKLASPQEGLDFNRNFPFEWRTEGDQRGAGPYPASEIEVKSLVEFIVNHSNINIGITFHTFSRVILRSYSTKPDEEMNSEDLWLLKKIGDIGSEITGYRCVSTYHDFKYHPKEVISGAFDDWMYDHLGMISFTVELWDLPTEAGIKDRKFIEWFQDHPHEEDLQILKWIDENANPGAYIDWYEIDHPQLGKVELGGWNSLFSWRNPPQKFVGAEAERNTPFILSLAEMLPHLKIHTLEVSELGTNTFHVNLVIENTGFLPSYTTEQGKIRKVVRPVQVELDIPEEVEILTGDKRVEIAHLEGRSNKLSVAPWDYSPTDNRARVEWVLHAIKGKTMNIHITSERAGKISTEIQLA